MTMSISRISSCTTLILASVILWSDAWPAEELSGEGWPREIGITNGTVVIYQPQPESLQGNQLTGRMAVSVESSQSTAPVFGAMWFAATLQTDRDNRTANISDLNVTDVRFPDVSADKQAQLVSELEAQIEGRSLLISLDRLLTSLDIAEDRAEASQRLSMTPPVVLLMDEPAILVTIDGQPELSKVEGSGIERVINTPFTILRSDGRYYLFADTDVWYSANDLQGEWQLASQVPSDVAALAPEIPPEEQGADQQQDLEPGPAPKVIIATQPTELIVSDGKAEYAPIEGTSLLYMSNTDSDVLMDITSQYHYILLSGRWYRSQSLDGPWQHVASDSVPNDFLKIPEDSEQSTVLYAVAGTDESREAVVDAQIPQTASIDRNATLSVTYDGEPVFEPIQGTDMSYAANTETAVIKIGSTYYALDEAVWFVGQGANGPWAVATSIPDTIYTIPPESPVYYVTFVRIYGSTDDLVYTGYTQGYTNTYVYNTTIVYGTGYYYPSWHRRYYYPRYSSWGFHVRYNPWTGWNLGFSYGWGPFRFTIGGGGWYRGGWWGPGRYSGYRRGSRHGDRRGAYAGYRAGQGASARQNLYRNQANANRAVATQQRPSAAQNPARVASNRSNNVYADQNGNVHRRNEAGWESRTRDGWQSTPSQGSLQQRPQDGSRQPGVSPQTPPATQPTAPPSQPAVSPQPQPVTQPTTAPAQRPTSQPTTTQQQLDRSHQSRQRGTQRTQRSNQSRSRQKSRGGRRR